METRDDDHATLDVNPSFGKDSTDAFDKDQGLSQKRPSSKSSSPLTSRRDSLSKGPKNRIQVLLQVKNLP